MANKRVKLTNEKFGVEQRQDILDGISENGTYLPKPVLYDDIDRAVNDFVESDVDLSIKGSDDEGDTKVPVFFLSIQKWTEFNKSWGSSDEYKDVKMPFITVVRDPDVQQGTNQNQFWNIPGRRNYTYYKVPTFNNGRVGMDLYKIPQPTSVDMTYQVRFFSNRMQELNILHNIIQRKFDSLQHYITVNGHPMPLILESVNDESKTEDMDARKYYVQTFEIKCLAYILDESDFEVVPTLDRSMLHINGGGGYSSKPKPTINKTVDIDNESVEFLLTFKHKSLTHAKIKINEHIRFENEVEVYNLTEDISYTVNGVIRELPFEVKRNDVMRIAVNREEEGTSSFKLGGILV